MNRIIVFKLNVSWSFPLPAPSGCAGNGGTENNISKKAHSRSPGAPGGRWTSMPASVPLCLPLCHTDPTPTTPACALAQGMRGHYAALALMIARGWYTHSHHPHPLQNTHFITAFKGTRFSAFVVSFPWIISEFLQWLAAVAPVE